MLPAPKSFGVLFVPQALATTTAKGNGVQTPNQVALYYPDAGRADAATLDTHLGAMPQANGASDVVTRAEQSSNATLNEDIQGFSEPAVLFPLLFLTAAGMATYVAPTRRVARDRAVIGMLRASGFRQRPLAVHYLWTGLIVGIGGAIPGVIVGVLAAGALTRVYTHSIGIPVTVVHINATTVLVGLAFGIVAGRCRRWPLPCPPPGCRRRKRCAGSNPPADGAPSPGWNASSRAAPDAGRCLASRAGACPQLAAHLYTEIGIVLALILILVSGGMLDSTNATLNRQFDQVQLENRAGHARHAGDPRGAGPDVGHQRRRRRRTFEPAARHDRHRAGRLRDRSGRLHPRHHDARVPATRRRSPGVPDSELLLGVELQHRLHLSTGGPVAAQVPGQKRADVEVAGFVDEPLARSPTPPSTRSPSSPPGSPSTVLLCFTPSVTEIRTRTRWRRCPACRRPGSESLRQQVMVHELFDVSAARMPPPRPLALAPCSPIATRRRPVGTGRRRWAKMRVRDRGRLAG